MLVTVCFLVMMPVLFVVSKSTQTRAEVFCFPPQLGPGTAFLDNYRTAWNTFNLGLYMKNSLIIASIVMFFKTIFSMLAGLGLVYFDFPFKNAVFYYVLFTLMMPTEIMIIALFNLVSDLGWGNNYATLAAGLDGIERHPEYNLVVDGGITINYF